MICPKCGDDLPKDAKTCKSCGNNIRVYRESGRIVALISVAIILLVVVIVGLYFIRN